MYCFPVSIVDFRTHGEKAEPRIHCAISIFIAESILLFMYGTGMEPSPLSTEANYWPITPVLDDKW
jgi:hypothetical protein